MTDTKVMRIEEDLLPIIRRYSDGSVSDGIRAMHRIIVENAGGQKVSPEEVAEVMRKVCQVEGVMLHEKQKGFFREIFASLMKCIVDKGLTR